MATNLVNLDALIPRDDFHVSSSSTWKKQDSISIRDLEPKSFLYSALRKPDFQRETANWTPAKIVDFVKTFLEGDLVPAVILWSAGESVFVIDGSHRLSALIAWVQDDYGDGAASRAFYQNYVPGEQVKAAQRTKRLIDKEIGTYAEHKAAVEHPENSKPEVLARAKRLGSLGLQLQWIPATDAEKAEASFFKINQQATPIDPTELRILKARRSANALSARIIVRNATGHKYWSTFDESIQKNLEEVGRDIYSLLFMPPLDTPIKTLDLPVAGRGYSGQTLPLIFDLVNLANQEPVLDSTKPKKDESDPPIDQDGSKTLAYLKETRKLARRVTGTHPSSLGLHPAVYFYSITGRYQPTAFLAVASLVLEFEKLKRFPKFIEVRSSFEEFLVSHKDFINQAVRKFGSGVKGLARVQNLYGTALEFLWEGKSANELPARLQATEDFSFLSVTPAKTAAKKRTF